MKARQEGEECRAATAASPTSFRSNQARTKIVEPGCLARDASPLPRCTARRRPPNDADALSLSLQRVPWAAPAKTLFRTRRFAQYLDGSMADMRARLAKAPAPRDAEFGHRRQRERRLTPSPGEGHWGIDKEIPPREPKSRKLPYRGDAWRFKCTEQHRGKTSNKAERGRVIFDSPGAPCPRKEQREPPRGAVWRQAPV